MNGRLSAVRIAILLPLAVAACNGEETPPHTTLEDLEFLAYVDVDQDGLAGNDEPRMLRLSEYFAANRAGTRIIMINAAAGWCSPCMQEASAIPEFVAAYQPRGVAVLTAVFQDQNGDPADAAFTKLWAENFSLPNPTLVDSSFATSKYFDVSAMPANLFADATTLEILSIATGAEPGGDPLKTYRELLDFYLE